MASNRSKIEKNGEPLRNPSCTVLHAVLSRVMRITAPPQHDCHLPDLGGASAPGGAEARWRCPECRQRWRIYFQNYGGHSATRVTNLLSWHGESYRWRWRERRRLQRELDSR